MTLRFKSKAISPNNKSIYLICFILLLNFLFFIYYFISPVPFGDDLPTIYEFLLKLHNSSSLSEKIQLMISNNFVEHKLLFFTILVSILYGITGKISLPLFALSAGLAWTSIFFFYQRWIKSFPRIWLLSITFVLVSLASYQAIFWTMAGLQHLGVTFMCFLTIYLLCKVEKLSVYSFLPAIVAGMICTFSSGNGMAVWPAGFLALLLLKNYKALMGWVVSSALGIGLYLSHVTLKETPSGSKISGIFDNLPTKILNIITGLAGATYFDYSSLDLSDSEPVISFFYPAIYIGLFIIICFILVLLKAYQRTDRDAIAVVSVSLFMFITFAFITIGRSSEGIFVIFKSRYYPYSIIALANMLFCVAYLTYNNRNKHIFAYVFLVFSSLLWGVCQFSSYINLLNQRNLLSTGYINFMVNKNWIIYQPSAFYENYYNTFFNQEKAPLVTLPKYDILTAFQNKKITNQGFHKCLLVQSNNSFSSPFISVQVYNGEAPGILKKDEGYAIVMASEMDTIFLPTQLLRNSLKQLLLTGKVTRKGYVVNTPLRKGSFPEGTYQLHQFYFNKQEGRLNPQSEGTIHFQ
ncbi:hypothetical protein QE390_004180 [Siphonobacter sp. SORGH_AS 1065]|nr:hypothetical protein [Siphonobacter sp. SORGH_AS_1065]